MWFSRLVITSLKFRSKLWKIKYSTNQYFKEVLERNLSEVLTSLESHMDLFESLSLNYPQRLKAVIEAVRTPQNFAHFNKVFFKIEPLFLTNALLKF